MPFCELGNGDAHVYARVCYFTHAKIKSKEITALSGLIAYSSSGEVAGGAGGAIAPPPPPSGP